MNLTSVECYMVIERNSVGCPGPHDGVFLILIENVDLFEDGISLIDIINALRRAVPEPIWYVSVESAFRMISEAPTSSPSM